MLGALPHRAVTTAWVVLAAGAAGAGVGWFWSGGAPGLAAAHGVALMLAALVAVARTTTA